MYEYIVTVLKPADLVLFDFYSSSTCASRVAKNQLKAYIQPIPGLNTNLTQQATPDKLLTALIRVAIRVLLQVLDDTRMPHSLREVQCSEGILHPQSESLHTRFIESRTLF